MFARLCVLVLATLLCVSSASAQFFRRADRSQPAVADLQRIVELRGVSGPNDIAEHRCERRPSALFGRDTFRCAIMMTGGSEMILVITFDSGWVVVGR